MQKYLYNKLKANYLSYNFAKVGTTMGTNIPDTSRILLILFFSTVSEWCTNFVTRDTLKHKGFTCRNGDVHNSTFEERNFKLWFSFFKF